MLGSVFVYNRLLKTKLFIRVYHTLKNNNQDCRARHRNNLPFYLHFYYKVATIVKKMDYNYKLFEKVTNYLKDRDTEARMTQCTEVYPDVFVGSDVQAENKRELIIMGITDVISFDVHFLGYNFYRDSGLHYHPVDIADEAEPTKNYIPVFIETADLIDRITRKNGKAFLFCSAGYRKSPAVAMAYLMTRRRMNLLKASKLVSKTRRILPHEGLVKQLCVLDKTLYGVYELD